MTIASEITKLQTNLENAYTAISNRGGTLPASQNFDNLDTAIDSVPTPDVWHNWKNTVYTRDFDIYSVYQINPVNDETKILTAELVGNTYVYKQVNSTGLDNFNSLEAVIKIKFNTTIWPTLELFSVFGGSAMGSYPFVKLYAGGWSEYNGYNREKAFPDDKQIDTWYWLKVVYNNTTHTFTNSYSTDGINWTVASIRTVEFTIYPNNKYIGLGVALSGSYHNSYFYYDLAACYVKVDNNIIWTPYQETSSQCYTLTSAPTTFTQVYEIPKKTSALTITAVGTGTITLSDSKVYNRNSAGDVQSPVLGTKTIDTNGTYTAASDYLDGFSGVTVELQEIGIPLEISSGVLQPKSSSFEIDWPDVTSINCGSFGLTNAFSNSAITKFSLPNLILSTTQANNLLQCCKGCTSLTTVDLSSLQESKGTGGLSYAFYGCTNLTSVNMQNLETIEGYNVFNYTFYNTGLTSFRFQKLKSISHGSGFLNTAMDCSFGGTTPITSLYFDVLETVARQENLQNMLSGVTGCTVHFPAALQSSIGSWTSVTNGFGGTNTTVLFDL